MSVDFRIADFFQPFSILRYHRLFERNQWLSRDRLQAYQAERLRGVIRHAYEHVPHYRSVMDERGVRPEDIRSVDDIRRLPVLSREEIRRDTARFHADNRSRYRPMAMHTSGSSGRRLDFLLDRATNAVEFAYYWRHWSWAGYRLGDPFAEFSSTFFLKPENERLGLVHRQRGTGRLLLNSLQLSRSSVVPIAEEMKRHGARYLKALPSVAMAFVRLLKDSGTPPPMLRAVFSTGEVLFPHQRQAIESAFGCRVFESYGHMERVIAASECPAGKLHVNPDYGLLELGDPLPSEGGRRRAPILGTTLYNCSMPLLRYDTGDVAEFETGDACSCGRTFPVLGRIEGRQEDTIVTPDGRFVTTLYLAFDEIASVRMGQIVQESADRLLAKVVGPAASAEAETEVISVLRRFVGDAMKIYVEFVPTEAALVRPGEKLRVVRSKLAASYQIGSRSK